MKATDTLEFFRKDRKVAVTRDGEDAERFEFSKSTQRNVRREKRIAARATRHSERLAIAQAIADDLLEDARIAALREEEKYEDEQREYLRYEEERY